ncbi:MFS transporter [Metasolibacillus sp. FSL K6-0083]|uniref:MFS transporter n=1 Tax=Metasolibacillus sp. FSL K6-0083 TaxID=2921416 RepID=UPI003159A1C3
MKEPIWTKGFIALFFTNISIFIVFYALVAALPLYAIGVLQRTDDEAGLLLSIFLLSAIIVRPFTGKILNYFGKQKMLWIGLAFYVICTILYYVIQSFTLLLALRFFQGIWFSIITTAAISIIVDIIPKSRRGAGIGYFNMSTNIAVVIGPLVALPIIQNFSFDLLFLLLSGLMLCGTLASLVTKGEKISEVREASFSFSLNDLFEKAALPTALLSCLVAFSYAGILSYLTLYAQEKNILSFVSVFYFVVAIGMLAPRPWTGKIFDEKGAKYVIIPGLIFFAIGIALLALVETNLMFLIAGAFIGIGYGAVVPSMQTVAVQATNVNRSSYATATFFTFFDLGIAVGSYVLGILALHSSYQTMYFTGVGIVIFALFCYLISTRVRPKSRA